MKNIKLFLFALAMLGAGTVGYRAVSAQAAPACDFVRDLEIGIEGEDVLCLQKFLNGNGFTITDNGPGSPGSETDLFGPLTEEAVRRWQSSQGISPASGYFGSKSRTAYVAAPSAGSGVAVGTESSGASLTVSAAQEIANKINEYIETIKRLEAENAALKEGSKEDQEAATVRKLLQQVDDLTDDADNAIDDADDVDASDIDNAKDDLNDAVDDFWDGLLAFIDQDYGKARSRAEDAIDTLEGIIDDMGGKRKDAEKAIDDADEAITDAKREIRDADRDGESVDKSNDLLDDASNKLDRAESAYDDEEYKKAIDYADSARSLARSAVRAIGD